MAESKILHQVKFSKSGTLPSLIVPLVMFEPLRRMILQGLQFREYYWFMICLLVVAFLAPILRPVLLMLTGRAALTLTTKGLGISSLGYRIDWSDMAGVECIQSQGKSPSYLLKISVNDPWKYISTTLNPLLRYYRWYTKDYFDPFTIDLGMLDGNSDEIYAMVETCFHQYRQHG